MRDWSGLGLAEHSGSRRTLKSAIGCVGVGLHGGENVRLTLRPAPAGAGIVFFRTDLNVTIPALYDHVSDTRLCTVVSLAGNPEARVGTIEHLMSALLACQIDDLIIEVDAAEIPILDGSAEPFLFLIRSAGIAEHAGAREIIEILRPVRAEQGESFAELRPHQSGLASGFDLSLAIDFAAPAIGRQAFNLSLTEQSFAAELAPARTFTMAAEVEALRKAGLAKGGSLANAIVVNHSDILNPEGLRWDDEFVRHKMLDVVGDIALAGAPISGRFIGNRTGHALNNTLLRNLFADAANYRIVRQVFAGSAMHMAAAASAF
jgi:UDP-3-O-[3-hydroxymyristoyl] N-acetylglucosamine deacetylase